MPGASATLIDELARAGTKGIVVAATGNGTVHEVIERAVQRDASCAYLYATLKGKGHRYRRVSRSLADWLLQRPMAMLRDRTLYDPHRGKHGLSMPQG